MTHQQAAAQAVGQALGGRETVYLGEGQVAPDGFGLAGRGILIAVKITESAGRENDVVPTGNGPADGGRVAPYHHLNVRGHTVVQHLFGKGNVKYAFFIICILYGSTAREQRADV